MNLKTTRSGASVSITAKDAVPLACLLSHAARGDISYDDATRRRALVILHQLAAICEGLDGDADAYLHTASGLYSDAEKHRLREAYNKARRTVDPGYAPEEEAARG
jgi:hypothetical protein